MSNREIPKWRTTILPRVAARPVAAQPVEQPEALYPAGAAAENVTGTVRLRVLVGRRGEVEDVQVVRSSGDDRLDEAAVDAVWHWRYRPARRDGRPVRVTDYVEVEFYRESEDRPED